MSKKRENNALGRRQFLGQASCAERREEKGERRGKEDRDLCEEKGNLRETEEGERRTEVQRETRGEIEDDRQAD